MNVIVILRVANPSNVVAIVEKPSSMSDEATVLAWAKSHGYERFPKDCRWESANVTSFATVILGITPYSIINELNEEVAKGDSNV